MPENTATTASSSSSALATFWRFSGLGAGGGLCAFFLSRLLGAGPFISKPIYLDLPGEMLFGALAALFGVYLLTASDMTAPRTMVFALACGLFWSPVITATQSYLQQHSDNQTVATAQQAENLLSTPSATQAPATVQTASDQASTALSTLPAVSTSASRTAIVNSTSAVVTKIATPEATTVNVDALKSIGLASVRGNAPTIGLLTLQKLRMIAASSPVLETREAALSAEKQIVAASPTLATAATAPAPK